MQPRDGLNRKHIYCYRSVFTLPLHINGSFPIVAYVFIYAANLFTESLPSNESLFWLRYSGFQTSCHGILRIMYLNSVL
jgi:hypothetical protein